jgi:sulfur carrier protein
MVDHPTPTGAPTPTPASIVVNGRPRTVAPGRALAALLGELGLPAGSVVVELNGVALTPSETASATLADGDTMEIVRAVAGG